MNGMVSPQNPFALINGKKGLLIFDSASGSIANIPDYDFHSTHPLMRFELSDLQELFLNQNHN